MTNVGGGGRDFDDHLIICEVFLFPNNSKSITNPLYTNNRGTLTGLYETTLTLQIPYNKMI